MTNILKTIFLLGLLSIIFIFIGGALGGQNGLYFALIFSLIMNVGAYFFSDKLALAASGAQPLSESEYPKLYAMIKELSMHMQLPMPKLYITPMKQANAFATGRDPHHASVAVTAGILEALSEEELKGVLAHELAHVKNRDILIASIAAVFASAISFIGNMAMFGGYNNDDDEGSPMTGILALVAALILPIGATLIQFAISRQREYGADETGAKIMGTGKPLATALLAIHDTTKQAPARVNPAYSSLYIDNPTGGIGSKMMNLFSTHPPVEERVKRLERI